MKLMFASDIHGSAPDCELMLRRFEEEKAEKLFLLGDILYHGPRNDLPAGYAPKKVIELLNAVKDRLFCVRGNCDTEVDQMVLDFPIMAEYALLFLDSRTVFLTHGHKFGKDFPPALGKNDILICGHTHIQEVDADSGFVYMNTGSVSLPKNGKDKSYIVYKDGVFSIKKLETAETETSFQTYAGA